MNKSIYYVKGMHCASCELLIEEKVLQLDGVEFADASMGKNTIEIGYTKKKPSVELLNSMFKESGYVFSSEPFKSSSGSMVQPILVAAFAVAVFLMLSKLGLSSFVNISSGSSLAAFFVFGIIAGASTCAALVGGLILSLSKQWNEAYGKNDSFFEKSKPHVLFNIGRLVSYALVGGLLGFLGAKLKISVTFTSIIVLIVSAAMLVLAMQMLGVEWFNRLKIALPRSWSAKVSDSKDSKGKFAPFIVGFFTFLLPCGFTLASEGMAVLSGDPFKGSLIMAAFAIGTALPLLAIGLFSAKLIANPKTSEKFLKTAGILIIFFVLYNIDFQFGIVRHFTDRQQPEQIQNNNQNPIAQVIKATYSQSGGIVPNAFEVKVGQPVRLEIAAQDDGFGCMSTVMVPGLYNYPQALKKGKTLIMEFTPNKVGTYQITCAMGVPWGTIIVK